MIKFKSFLFEIFDQPYPFKSDPFPSDIYGKKAHAYYFESPNDQYKVNFHHDEHGKGHTALEFWSTKGHLGKSKAEGTNAHKIFSTVHKVVKHHFETNPDQKSVTFSAVKSSEGDEGSRVKLYRHLANKFANKHKEFYPYGDNEERSFHIKREDMK